MSIIAESKHRKGKRLAYRTAYVLSVILFISFIFIDSSIYAFTDSELADAIFKAEGGYKAQYLYGIRSVSYKTEVEARKICLNTIRNNKKRFLQQTEYKDYLDFFSSRYCPVGCDNDRGTNRYWLKNVKYFLRKGGSK